GRRQPGQISRSQVQGAVTACSGIRRLRLNGRANLLGNGTRQKTRSEARRPHPSWLALGPIFPEQRSVPLTSSHLFRTRKCRSGFSDRNSGSILPEQPFKGSRIPRPLCSV